MAEQKQLPEAIAKVHSRFFTPYISVLCTAAIMLVFTLRTDFVEALTISAIARLVTYAVTCLSLPVFRRRKDTAPAAFHLPGGTIISILSLVLAGWLLSNSNWKDARAALAVAAVGLVIFLVYRLARGREAKDDS
jgi:amino acid transporter